MAKTGKGRRRRPSRVDPLVTVTPLGPESAPRDSVAPDYRTPTAVNADFADRVIIETPALDWLPSPLRGVDRRMLDRVGGEVARATSIVRYAPNSRFAPHEHGGGEEFFVLEGVFSDEHGDHRAGTYVRNPPGTRHTPRSEPGCILFVKLWQMRRDGNESTVVVDTTREPWQETETPGHTRMPLFAPEAWDERVALERLAAETTVAPYLCPGGEEILVLAGELTDGSGIYRTGTWLRQPPGFATTLMTRAEGCTLWVKRGHLADLDLNHFRAAC